MTDRTKAGKPNFCKLGRGLKRDVIELAQFKCAISLRAGIRLRSDGSPKAPVTVA